MPAPSSMTRRTLGPRKWTCLKAHLFRSVGIELTGD